MANLIYMYQAVVIVVTALLGSVSIQWLFAENNKLFKYLQLLELYSIKTFDQQISLAGSTQHGLLILVLNY
jgi:hypothetical protein